MRKTNKMGQEYDDWKKNWVGQPRQWPIGIQPSLNKASMTKRGAAQIRHVAAQPANQQNTHTEKEK
jgi:hypothetical protein